MFSVGARPFNSRRRQLYGGWASGIKADTTEAQALARWDRLPDDFVADTKWASMAEKYALDPATRDIASNIRSFSKGYLAGKRELYKKGDPKGVVWIRGYNAAQKGIRSKYKLSSLSPGQKDAIWQRFVDMPFGKLSDEQALYLQMANRAPLMAKPKLPLDVTGSTNFVLDDPSYALPSKLDVATRTRLAQARRGPIMSKADAADAIFRAVYDRTLNNYDEALQSAQALWPAYVPPDMEE